MRILKTTTLPSVLQKPVGSDKRVVPQRFGDAKPSFDQTALEVAIAKLIQHYGHLIPPTLHSTTTPLNTKRERVMAFFKIMQALQKDFCPQNEEQAFQQMKSAFGAVENAAVIKANTQWDYMKKDGRKITQGATDLKDEMIVEPEERSCIRLVSCPVSGRIIRKGPVLSGPLHYIQTTKEDIFLNNQGAIQIVRRWGQYSKRDLEQKNVPLSLVKQHVIFDKLGADNKDVWGETSKYTQDPRMPYIAPDWRIGSQADVLFSPI